MVPVGSGAREGPTHGVLGGGRSVDGCGSRAGLWGSVACGGGGCVLLPVSYYEEVMRVKTAWGLRPESLGRGNGALAAGYPRMGWPGCPGAPWGRRLPTSAGCETTACFSVTEVLRFRPQELTRRGDCGPGRPRGMIMKRKRGARMSLAVGTFLRPGGGRCPALLPLPCARGAVVGGGVVPPNRRLCPVPWVQTPVGGGYEAPGRLAPPAQQPARRRLAFSASCRGGRGGGARGSAGPLRSPGGPHCPCSASRGGAGSYRTRGPRRPSRGGGQGGVKGVAAGGWRVAGARTAHRRAPPPSSREAQLLGF